MYCERYNIYVTACNVTDCKRNCKMNAEGPTEKENAIQPPTKV